MDTFQTIAEALNSIKRSNRSTDKGEFRAVRKATSAFQIGAGYTGKRGMYVYMQVYRVLPLKTSEQYEFNPHIFRITGSDELWKFDHEFSERQWNTNRSCAQVADLIKGLMAVLPTHNVQKLWDILEELPEYRLKLQD